MQMAHAGQVSHHDHAGQKVGQSQTIVSGTKGDFKSTVVSFNYEAQSTV